MPLDYIGTSSNGGDCGSRLFAAAIAILDLLDGEASHEPLVLVVQCCSNKNFHAIEKVKSGVYALCGLAPWVTLCSLKKLGSLKFVQSDRQRVKVPHGQSSSEKAWWKTASVLENNEQGPVRLSPNADWISDGPRLSISITSTNEQGSPRMAPAYEANLVTAKIGPPEQVWDETLQDTDTVLHLVKTQYQEALYVSKVGVSNLITVHCS